MSTMREVTGNVLVASAVVSGLLLLATGESRAADPAPRVAYTVALQKWLTSNDLKVEGKNVKFGGGTMAGVRLGADYQRYFISGAWSATTSAYVSRFPEDRAAMKRTDWDVVAGYRCGWIRGFVGYANVSLSGDVERTLSGPEVGLSASYELRRFRCLGLGIYGRGVHSWTRSEGESLPGYDYEGGVVLNIPVQSISSRARLGYRSQRFDRDAGDMVFEGLIVEYSLTF